VPLRKNLEAKFSSLPAGTKYSFYFEYLPSGTSIRIGDDNELVAASLIKVPLVMDLYRAAELGLTDLDKEVVIREDEIDSAYGDLWKQGAGTKVSLRTLAKLAVSQSDNTASRAIFNHIKFMLKPQDQCLVQLDVDQKTEDGQAVITAKSYSSVLKSLYFASCVDKTSSNEILSYLTQSSEVRRITKFLPTKLTVAHKNGVYNQTWSESDCGIVYAEKRPYVLCMMIGLPINEADMFMADISKDIYDYVSAKP
jgi:beta-lactamase class A